MKCTTSTVSYVMRVILQQQLKRFNVERMLVSVEGHWMFGCCNVGSVLHCNALIYSNYYFITNILSLPTSWVEQCLEN